MNEFNYIRDKVRKDKIQDIRVRGLKLDGVMGNLKICQIEILIASEEGLSATISLLQ